MPARRGARERSQGPIVVVADSALAAARVEALVRDAVSARVVIANLATVAAEDDGGIVILAMSPDAVLRALDALSAARRGPSVIVLASEPREVWTAHARRAGVAAVLGQDASAEELAAAITATRAGLIALHPDAVEARPRAAAQARGAPATLTSRELDVLEMMAEGMSNRAIAARLKISRYTVKFHVASLLGKLGVGSRTEAVTAGVRQGLISL